MLDATSPRHADVTRHGFPIRIGFALCFVAVLFAGAAHEASARPATSSERTRALDSYGRLAIGFIMAAAAGSSVTAQANTHHGPADEIVQ